MFWMARHRSSGTSRSWRLTCWPGSPTASSVTSALLADILDVLHGSSPAAKEQSPSPPTEELSPGELRVLRYLPTNLSRPEIASELSVSLNTVGTHLRG